MARWWGGMRWRPQADSVRVLIGLLIVDLGFVVAHAGHVRYDVPGSGLWLLSRDRGLPELFQYLKLAAVILLLVDLYRRSGRQPREHASAAASPLYLVWAITFTYLLLDDSIEIHEHAGEWLGATLGLDPVLGIDQRDLGQVLFSGLAGIVVLGAIALAYRNDRSPARSLTHQLVVLVGALAFFGIAADAIDAIDLFGVVEDGGEMVMVSVIVATVVDHRLSTVSPSTAADDNSAMTLPRH